MTVFPNLMQRHTPSRRDDLTNWIEKFFEGSGDGWLAAPARGELVPALNIAEDQKAMTVAVELPGFDEKDIHVTATKSLLTISGERKWEEERKGKEWRRVESQYGSFTRTLTLPANLKTDQIEAVFSKGILTLTLPKIEPTPSTQVKIKAQ